MKTLHLFAGAGGGIIADMMLGNQPLAAVEIDPFCRRVLKARQFDGSIPFFPIFEDVRRFDGSEFRDRVECICGGFPCQNISIAGGGAGITGEESGLFFELARIVGTIRPKFVFLENSPLLVSRGIDSVCGEMVKLGYSGAWLLLPASAVGAFHKRLRWWGLFTDADGEHGKKFNFSEPVEKAKFGFNELCAQIPDAVRGPVMWRGLGPGENFEFRNSGDRKKVDDFGLWREFKSGVGRVPDGLADGVDRFEKPTSFFWRADEWGIPRITEHCPERRKRLISIGNGQVPACAVSAFLILFEMLKASGLLR